MIIIIIVIIATGTSSFSLISSKHYETPVDGNARSLPKN